ncbi:MAG TPA: hypothetical protein VGW99_06045 [Chthoniobacterales bacterium]|nr:hypothetical protein [Chthoniobacterales bacterium]
MPFRDCGTPEKSTCDVFRPEMKTLGHVDKLAVTRSLRHEPRFQALLKKMGLDQ